MGGELNEPRQIYERLWQEAAPALARNDLELDRHLLDKSRDLRRSLTLVVRPLPAVQAAISGFLQTLAAVAPRQYFYRPAEFHVTVLAIIPGSELWREKIQRLGAYSRIIAAVLKKHRQFWIKFQGVTAARNAVMIQGFPADDTLAMIRDDLRKAFSQNQLGEQLDARYKISAAHITVMRFCDPPANGKQLLASLEASRAMDFGESRVETLELILGDWYTSVDTVRTLQEYKLADQPSPGFPASPD